MKNKAILSVLLFVFTYTKAEGQTIVYTYNAQGSCTSRVIKGTPPKAKKAPKVSIDTKRLKVDLSPSPTFQNQLSISRLWDCRLAIIYHISWQMYQVKLLSMV